jgi:hypothetical protein
MRADDAVILPVRIVAALVVAVLVLAVIVLYGRPGETERLWAWTIGAPMTTMLMGAGYAAGAYFFARAALARSWRTVTLGFLPVTVFTTMLLIATVSHWGNFNHSHAAFIAWTGLYLVTPVLIPALWYLNRPRDPGREPGDVMVPFWPRAVLVAFGAVLALLAGALFISPNTVGGDWPWELTPLTARTVAAYIALTGVTLLLIAWDARWRAARVPVESLAVGMFLIIVAIVRAWDTLDPSQAVRWLYVTSMVLSLLLLVALHRGMDAVAAQPAASAVPGAETAERRG